MLDPTCADITGRVLEALGANRLDRAIRRSGAAWNGWSKHQEADGSWYGRWGVAYIYGTCFALRGLAAAGESDREAHVLRARRMASLDPERGRRLGRKLCQLRQRHLHAGAEHAFADRLGRAGADRRRRCRES